MDLPYGNLKVLEVLRPNEQLASGWEQMGTIADLAAELKAGCWSMQDLMQALPGGTWEVGAHLSWTVCW